MTDMKPTFGRFVAAGVAIHLERDGWRRIPDPNDNLNRARSVAQLMRDLGTPLLSMERYGWEFSLTPVDLGTGTLTVILTQQEAPSWDSFDIHVGEPADTMRRIAAVIRAAVGGSCPSDGCRGGGALGRPSLQSRLCRVTQSSRSTS